jgi:hypothetical protein
VDEEIFVSFVSASTGGCHGDDELHVPAAKVDSPEHRRPRGAV